MPVQPPVFDYPELSLHLPRPVRSVHQIEITSRCNLRCVYCVQPTMARSRVDMSLATYIKALAMVKHFISEGTQEEELNLAGIGESILHPDFPEYVRMARETVGPDCALTMASNGIAWTEDLVRAIAPYKPQIWVSLHRPEHAARGVFLLREHGLLEEATNDPVRGAMDWAGQVSWMNEGPMLACQWLRHGRVMITSTGTITTCCLDGDGRGIVGTVDDDPRNLRMHFYPLCPWCVHHEVRIRGWDKAGAAPLPDPDAPPPEAGTMVVHSKPLGIAFEVPDGDQRLGRIELTGWWERTAQTMIGQALHRADGKGTLVDIGAGYGFVSLPAAKIFPEAYVCTYSPVDRERNLLRRSCARNDIQNVSAPVILRHVKIASDPIVLCAGVGDGRVWDPSQYGRFLPCAALAIVRCDRVCAQTVRTPLITAGFHYGTVLHDEEERPLLRPLAEALNGLEEELHSREDGGTVLFMAVR